VRVQSLARLLFALLAFQLALGLQVGVAYASTISTPPEPTRESGAAHESSAANSSDDSCPMHNASSPAHDASSLMHSASPSTYNANASSHTSAHAKAPLPKSADKHDCCKSSGCQGQCGNVPLAFNVSAIRGASATAVVQPIRATRVAVAPTDTHFRPPIAS
jgi:hypothetical protein